MKFDSIIIRYGEIFLKGGNRKYFEKKLVQNIKKQFEKSNVRYEKIEKPRNRFIIKTNDEKALEVLKNVLGITSFSPAFEVQRKLEKIEDKTLDLIKKINAKTFRVTSQRIDKDYEVKSPEINQKLGEFILKNSDWKVSLKKFDVNFGVEIVNKKAYLFTKKIDGRGGLPYGTGGKVLSLISTGIDSPVASYMMMKRGCIPSFLWFGDSEEEKKIIRKQIENLEKFSPEKLRLITISHKNLINPVVEKLDKIRRRNWTCIFCKHLMIKQAEEIANKENCDAIVMGDQVGQVASQTIENMKVIQSGIEVPILRPLVGMDKNEGIDLAKSIGTYETSIESKSKCPFLPSRVETKGKIEEFLEIKNKIEKK